MGNTFQGVLLPEKRFFGGMLEGGIEVVTELTPMRFFVGKFGKEGAVKYIAGILAREIPGEQAATLAQDAVDTAIANPDKTWGEYWAERPEAAYETLVATVTQSVIMGAPGAIVSRGSFENDAVKAEKAIKDQEDLTEQVEIISESKLKERSPEDLEQYLDNVLGVDNEVLISAEDANVFFQDHPDVLESLPDDILEDVQEALETNNDVAIKKSDYLTYLSEFHEELSDSLRNDMDGMTAKEANEWVEQGNEQFEEEAERILVGMEQDTEFQTSAENVAKNIKDQLVKTDRFTEESAEKYSQLHKAFAVTVASKLGITPEQVYEKFGLKIGATPLVNEEQFFQEAEQVGLVVAGIGADGKLYKGEEGDLHFNISDRYGAVIRGEAELQEGVATWQELGFVDETGKFLTRQEALVKIQKENPDFKPAEVMDDELDALDYQEQVTDLDDFVLFQKKKGTFNPDKNLITLLETADLSTFLHESAHFFFEAYKTLDNPEIQKDMQVLLDFIEIKDLETWNSMPFDERKVGHEKVARAFEAYLFEGKAPSFELQSIFQTFRDWLLNVYKTLKGLALAAGVEVKLTPEVQQVFDRMLATQEQIREKQVASAYEALFESQEQSGLSDKDWKEYQNKDERRKVMSESQLQTRSLKDMKWLSDMKGKVLRALQRDSRDKRKAMRGEVDNDVSNEPIYLAMDFFRTGETLDSEGNPVKVKDHKLNKEEFDEAFPNMKLRGLTKKDGIPLDLGAELLGFKSGEAMVQQMLESEPKRERIERLTDQRMLEAYGDLNDPVKLEQAVNEAVHNEAHTKFLHTELSHLTKKTGSRNVLARAAKYYAEQAISKKKIRDIKPFQYSVAESRAAKNAEKSLREGDRESAAEHKRAQVLNNHFFRAANNAQKEVEKIIRYLKKFSRKGVRKNLDRAYLDQIDSLLETYELKQVSLKELAKRQALSEWIASQEELGFEPIVDSELLNKGKNYKDMTFEEIRGLRDSIKNIEHLGRLKSKLLNERHKKAFQVLMDEATEVIESKKKKVKERGTPSDWLGKMGMAARGWNAEQRSFSSIVWEMDGLGFGPLYNLLTRGMSESGDRKTEMTMEDAKAMVEIFKPVMGEIRKGGIPLNIKAGKHLIPGTDFSMTKEEVYMFVMNWGNLGNRQRLLDGGMTGHDAITLKQAQAVIDTLSKEEMDFVQNILDYVGSKKELIKEQELRLTGVEPEWIESEPIVTRHGTYDGGYFPAIYDVMLSTRSESLEAVTNNRLGMKGLHGSAATRNSYTKERASEVKNRPLLLNFSAISRHLAEVNHRLAFQDWISDANRILAALDKPMREYYGPEKPKELRDTVFDIAAGDVQAIEWLEKTVNWFRIGATIVGLGMRVTTALIQPSGLAQSWVRIGSKNMHKGIKRFLNNPLKASSDANKESKTMKGREVAMQRELNEVLNTVRAGESHKYRNVIIFGLIQKFQRSVDVPTYWGAKEKALEDLHYEFATDEEKKEIMQTAIERAGQTVKDTQASGMTGDLPKIQRGNAFKKLWTNFFSYFSRTYNLNVEAFKKVKRVPDTIGLAGDLLIINTMPAIFSMALHELLKNECDMELECLVEKLASEQVAFLLGQTIPTREIGSVIPKVMGLESYEYKGPAGIRFLFDVSNLGTQIAQGDADFAAFKAAGKVAGSALHAPMGQILATVEGIIAIEDGEVEGIRGTLGALMAGPPR